MNSSEFQSTKCKGNVRIIFLGDIVGRPGRTVLKEKLRELRSSLNADVVIANGENAAGGAGIDPSTALEIKNSGVDLITLGDHAFQRKGSDAFLDEHSSWCIRPYNLPGETTPGKGACRYPIPGYSIDLILINLLGRVFISSLSNNPFEAMDQWLVSEKGDKPVISICDLHAEATSEKWAMARHVDGRVSLLVGTHTHVQTSDAQILPGGTAYITDLGMTGSGEGVIGMKSSVALQRFLSPKPAPYEIAPGEGIMHGVVADFCATTGKAKAISLI
jgi:2',3'-cyclic-nucleotide 2'-phosphodiesterase